MWTQQKRKIYRGYLTTLPLIVLIIYFSYHFYYGRYGIAANHNTHQQINLLKNELTLLTQAREALQKKISRLKDGTMEKDMLDEYLRRNFNLSNKKEVTILLADDLG